MMPFDAVIFDLDGLLVNSESVWMTCERALLARRGHVWRWEIQGPLLGQRMDVFLDAMIAGYGLDDTADALRAELTGEMCRLIPETVQRQPGATELVAFVAASGMPRAIASSSPAVIIEAIVDSQGWHDALPIRISAETVPHGKPAPDVYLKAARVLGVDPARCLALEDSPNGARSAVAAGMTCFAVPDPAHAGPGDFQGITPRVYRSLTDVLAHLRNDGSA